MLPSRQHFAKLHSAHTEKVCLQSDDTRQSACSLDVSQTENKWHIARSKIWSYDNGDPGVLSNWSQAKMEKNSAELI